MNYIADTEGWPVVIYTSDRRVVATFHCLESQGYPHLPAEKVYEYVESFLTVLNTSPSEKLAYFLMPPILASVFTLGVMQC